MNGENKVPKRKISPQMFSRLLPKIELHAHLNGSLSEETLQKLGCLEDSIFEYKKLTKILHKTDRTLEECFDLFKVAHNATRTAESVCLATKSVIADFARENTWYLEIRTTPRAEDGMSKEEYIESVIRGITTSEDRNKILVKLILSIDRRHSEKDSWESLNIILKMKEKYPSIIKGIDLSGNPEQGEFNEKLFEEARKNGLHTTIHCAEVKNDEEVERILTFGPDRIGHATFLHPLYGGSEKNWKIYCEKKIPVECCLTSNVVCGTSKSYMEHHIQEWINLNLPFSISTDDKGVFCTSLSKEHTLIKQHFTLTAPQLWQISYDAVEHTFATEEEKKQLQNNLAEWFYLFQDRLEVDENIDDKCDAKNSDLYYDLERLEILLRK